MGKFDGISAEQVQDRSWKFEEFQDYFQQEGKKWGNSSPFKAVVSAVKSYSKLRQKEITPESAIKLVNTNDALLKACAEYKSFKENEEKLMAKSLFMLVAVWSLLSVGCYQGLGFTPHAG